MKIDAKPRKKALVTGGANGLGRAIVDQLSYDGYLVYVVDKDQDRLRQLHVEGTADVMTHQLDLADRNAVIAQVPKLARLGPFDLVILNAGINATGNFEKIPMSAHRKLLEVNLVAPMIIATGFASQNAMTENSGIVFISSLSHVVGYPGAASYAATKDAIAIYAKSIRKPFAKLGVCVTCAFPGPIRTEHAKRHSPTNSGEKMRSTPHWTAKAILKAARAKQSVCYPGFIAKLSRVAGWFAPDWTAGKMRKIIYEKLDGEVF